MKMTLGSYEKIKKLAKELGCSAKDLLVLSQARDPFYAGGKGSRKKAEWFAAIWEREGFERGIHLRRIHYRLVSKEGITKADGTPYENTHRCWTYLTEAACHARYLGLVDPNLMVDRRNPEPYVRALPSHYVETSWKCRPFSWPMPRVNAFLKDGKDWEMPCIYPTGYSYSAHLQPYHLEVWVEKTTMNDVLKPLCDRFCANLVTGAGFLSVTSITGLMERIKEIGKPCRIFYISDFDPSGSYMPFSVSRQIEYWKDYYSINCNLKVTQLALTQEQVEKYKLPSIPIKESDSRKENFKKAYGQDATELDALEAQFPGELGRLVREELGKYFDFELENAYEETYKEALKVIREWKEKHLTQYEEELQKFNEEKRRVVQKYEKVLQEIQEKCEVELEHYIEPLENLRHAVENELNDAKYNDEIDLPLIPEPNVAGDEDDVWIYDSSRDYLEQLEVYKALMPNGKEIEWA